MNRSVWLLALLLQAPPAAGQDLAPTARGEARLRVQVERVQLGEPFELLLEVRHRAGDAPRVEPGELASDPAWAVLSGGELLSLPDGNGARLTELRWQVVALEPGVRALPAPRVLFAAAGDEPERELDVLRGELEVGGVLAAGEDAARPLPRALGSLAEEQAARAWWLVGPALLALLALGFVVLRMRRRARTVAPAPAASALQRLAALEALALDTPEQVRAAHYDLSRALREHIDGARAPARAALTDAEWVAALDPTADADLARLLLACEGVKYGAEAPTHWATRERVLRARALAQAHAGAEVAR